MGSVEEESLEVSQIDNAVDCDVLSVKVGSWMSRYTRSGLLGTPQSITTVTKHDECVLQCAQNDK